MRIVESTGLKTAGIHVRKNFNPDDSPVIGLDKYAIGAALQVEIVDVARAQICL